MAYLRVSRRGKRRYYYIVESRRHGDTARQKVLEYLGRDPTPTRLTRARDYWGVKAKAKMTPARRTK